MLQLPLSDERSDVAFGTLQGQVEASALLNNNMNAPLMPQGGGGGPGAPGAAG